ncbi:MAG: threonine--tRNA ligase [Deltaproteobacteria bacterium RIFOXYA12_FULL_61_11]|nr:MAG: threonine--tRNA ligase [Deltaproteobacteria bacterium RIFOXYA12_FULL_61_11]
MSQQHHPDDDQLHKLRHSLAHILAQAVLEVRPEAKLGFGPPVENGFYYDFDFGDRPIGPEDFPDLEERMQRIVKARQEFEGFEQDLQESEAMLGTTDQHYKIEYARELVEKGIAQGGRLTFFRNGPFLDMCEGPHLKHTGEVPKACFKLDKIAGSYWRGDEHRPMLTRIYALAFPSRDELKEFLGRRELAMQRDHKKLGAELELFFHDDDVGVGLPLWLPGGTAIREELERWAKEEEFRAGYQRVSTPIITRAGLYHRSGHLPYYAESMYPPMLVDEHDEYYLRPMNCPHHHKIYASRGRSYRELPLRLCEYGNVFRYEKHGSLSGLLRVRAMCMNDAHIYCAYEQIGEEFANVMALYDRYYQHLHLSEFRARLSLHDPDSPKFAKDVDEWRRCEDIMRSILKEAGVDFEEEVGEAAFYGPKLDLQMKNLMGREETVSTVQLDFLMPGRFGLTFTDRDGSRQAPYIIHRAPLSTHERFISFLIERFGGAFPTWLAPIQVALIPVGEHALAYADELRRTLTERLFRVELDDSSETFNKRIRTAVTRKIPNLWILGAEETAARSVTWRRYGVKEQQRLDLAKALDTLDALRAGRVMDNLPETAWPQI